MLMIKSSVEKGKDGWLDRSGRLLTALTFLSSSVVITIVMKEVYFDGDEHDIDDGEDSEDDGSDYSNGKEDGGDDDDKMER